MAHARLKSAAKPRKLSLNQGDEIVATIAKTFGGPGWTNRPIVLIVRDSERKLREVFLQPDLHTESIRLLFAAAEAMQGAMHEAVVEAVRYKRQSPIKPDDAARRVDKTYRKCLDCRGTGTHDGSVSSGESENECASCRGTGKIEEDD